MFVRAVLIAGASVAMLAGAALAQVAPPATTEAAKDAQQPQGQQGGGISMNIKRYEPNSKHFDRSGPKTEFISGNRAVDVARGEQAVVRPIEGGTWFMVSAGETSKSIPEEGVVVVTFADAEKGKRPVVKIENRLDRVFYVPPLVIDREAVSANVKAGRGCNLAPGATYSEDVTDKALSFVLANVEKLRTARPCGDEGLRFFPAP